MADILTRNERTILKQFIVDGFSLEGLEELAFDLGITAEFDGVNKRRLFAVRLIEYYEQRDDIGCLLEEILRRRYDGEIASMLRRLMLCQPGIKVQIIADGELLDEINQFLEDLMRRRHLSREQVKVLAVARGSVRLLVQLPTDTFDDSLFDPASLQRYRITSAIPLDQLDNDSQAAWRWIARNAPTVVVSSLSKPSLSWSDALRLTNKKLQSELSRPPNVWSNQEASPILFRIVLALGRHFGLRWIGHNKLAIIYRFGRYHKSVEGPNFLWINPFLDTIDRLISLEPQLVADWVNSAQTRDGLGFRVYYTLAYRLDSTLLPEDRALMQGLIRLYQSPIERRNLIKEAMQRAVTTAVSTYDSEQLCQGGDVFSAIEKHCLTALAAVLKSFALKPLIGVISRLEVPEGLKDCYSTIIDRDRNAHLFSQFMALGIRIPLHESIGVKRSEWYRSTR